MPKAIAETNKLKLVDDEGIVREIAFVLDTSTGQPWLEGRLYADGVMRAIFIRVKMTNSGHRIAADFPGCDPAYVTVDGDGRITNG